MHDWLAGVPTGQLSVSDWVMTEFSAALSVKLRTGQLEAVHRADALAVFAELIDDSFEVLPVSSLDFRTAGRFADQYTTGHRAGDALHLAVAYHHGARVRTLDQALISAAHALGVSADLL
jgi:hypothetical protein